MSPLKKARQQLSNEKEFYANGFLSEPFYTKWQKAIKPRIADEFVLLIQAECGDEERLGGLLKKHPSLVKVILHPLILKRIKTWYQQHPSADFKRKKRQQESLIDTLHILCARYKKQLRSTILNVSHGLIGIPLEGNLRAQEKNEHLPTQSHLDLTASQDQQLNRALKHYQAINKLQQTLEGEDFSAKKLADFMAVFKQDSVQATLCKRPPAWVTHLFQKLTAFCQFEHWLQSSRASENEMVSPDHDVLTELTQQIKKIPLYNN